MVVSLVMGLMDYTRLFQEVLLDLGTLYNTSLVEVNIDVFTKSAGVVVPDCLGVSKSLK